MPRRTIAELLTLGEGHDAILPIGKPYIFSDDDVNIDWVPSNTPLIAMARIYEGMEAPTLTDVEYLAAKSAAESNDADTDAEDAWTKAEMERDIQENWEKYSLWIIILVACQQTRDLTDKNLSNFCKMSGGRPMPSRAIQFISYWAAKSECYMENAAVRETFVDNLFFEYHTTGSSTPGLCTDAITESSGLGVFTAREVTAITSAYESRHDISLSRAIPSVTLVKVSAVLEASGTLPEIWYMGDKARKRFSGKKYSALVKYLRVIGMKQLRMEDIEDRDLPTLTNNLAELLSSFSTGEEAA